MKSIIAILACTTLAIMAAPAISAAEKDHVCVKCKVAQNVKATDHCPGCHGHMGFDVYGKSGRHGHYVHACTGCDPKTGPCAVAERQKTAGR